MEEIDSVVRNIIYRNLGDAIEAFKELNLTPAEFQDYVNNIEDIEIVKRLCLLGYYSRETK